MRLSHNETSPPNENLTRLPSIDAYRKGNFSLGLAPAVCILVALILVLLVGAWGLYRDLVFVRHTVIETEISQAKSHAERSVGRLETQLIEERLGADLIEVSHSEWLRDHWNRTIPQHSDRLYGAVADHGLVILAHSDPEFAGKRLDPTWSQKPWGEFGEGIYEETASELTGGVRAVDIEVPIRFENQIVGTYHVGIEAKWLEDLVAQARSRTVGRWSVVIVGILTIVFLSSVSLYRIARHTVRLEHALELADARRLGELSQLMIGMAHEVRNPLNSIRLNLYTTDRVFRGDDTLKRDEVLLMLSESVREIERVDDLVQQLLGYARVDTDMSETIEIHQEIRSMIQFLKHAFESDGIRIELRKESEFAFVALSRRRMRQILLNLFNNSREAMQTGGRILVSVQDDLDFLGISICDTGPGVEDALTDQVFDPFFTTRDAGTGLGLSVVRSLLESVGGSIICRRSRELGGSEFHIRLPRANQPIPERLS